MTSPTRLSLAAGIALLAGIACRDDNKAGLTDPITADTEAAVAAATTTPPAFAQISTGLFHTCAVATDSRAYCGAGTYTVRSVTA